MGYTEGTHDSPADTRERLVRVGSKHILAAPAVADGDNVYLAVDSEGRLITTGPEAITLLASAAQTATVTGADRTNRQHRGLVVYLDITLVSGTTPTLDVKLQGKDPASAKYYDIPGAAFSQKTVVSTAVLTVYPGIGETANESVSDVLPRTWRFVATIGGTTPSFTFSLGAALLT